MPNTRPQVTTRLHRERAETQNGGSLWQLLGWRGAAAQLDTSLVVKQCKSSRGRCYKVQ